MSLDWVSTNQRLGQQITGCFNYLLCNTLIHPNNEGFSSEMTLTLHLLELDWNSPKRNLVQIIIDCMWVPEMLRFLLSEIIKVFFG